MPKGRAAFRLRGPRRSRLLARLVPVTIVAALAGGMLGATFPVTAGASSVNSVYFSGASQAAGVVTTWTVQFSTGGTSSLSAGSTITISFAPGFSMTNPAPVTLASGFGSCAETNSTSGPTITITLANSANQTCAIGPGQPLYVQIGNVTNPGPGSYSGTLFTVYTSHDQTPTSADSPPFYLEPTVTITNGSVGEVSNVTFAAASYAPNATTSWTVGFTPATSLSSGAQIYITFASGFGIPSSVFPGTTSGFGSCSLGSGTGGGTTVDFALGGVNCFIPGGTPLTLQLLGIVNPGAGTYTNTDFQVWTDLDTNPNSPTTSIVIGGTGVVTTTAATAVTSSSATLNGTVNPGGTLQSCKFAYGTSNVLTGATVVAAPSPGNGNVAVAETLPIAGLIANTTYYFQLECSNGNGGIVSFFTGTGVVTTTAATSITPNSATLNGTENSGGVAQTCNFAYGTSGVLAGATIVAAPNPGSGSSAVAESVSVSGLTANTTYYFQLECTNGNGGILSFFTNNTPLPIQIYGTDPIGTSIAISQAEYPTNGSASAVVLARDDFFSDALAGGPLAAALNGPMLLTEGAPISATLDPRTQAEIQRVLPAGGTVYILGGNLAISPTVDSTLRTLGYQVVREAGVNAYATAVDIAQQMGNPSTIFEATGTSYYDALSAVPAAIKQHAAILLTNGNVQAPETAAYLSAHPSDVRYAIGGPLAAAGADPTATAIYGNDLYATSAAVASTFFPSATIFGAATSATFTDALGGGVYMATGGRSGPLLIVDPNTPLPAEILPYLASLTPGAQGYVFGGPLAIAPSVLTALQQAVG